ncbi:MAG TPA: AI-2E family transporter [Natronosporangium sp.]
MGRFEAFLANVRRAYETSRDTVRSVRSRTAQYPNNGAPPLERTPNDLEDALPPPPPAPPPPIDEAVPRSLRIAAAWSWRLIVVAAVGWGLLYLVDRFLILVAPMMIGLLLTGLLAPAYRWVRALKMNRSLATLIVLVGGLAVVGGTLTLVINQLIHGLPNMVDSAEQGIEDIQEWVQGPPLNMTDADLDNVIEQGRTWVEQNTQQLTDVGLSAVTGTVQFFTGFVLALVATFFFLRDGGRIWAFLVGMLPARARAPMRYAGDGAWRSLTGYVRATVLVALIDAVGIGIGLWILRVPLALPLAALVFIGAFIPIIGAFLSGTVAVLVALVDEQEPGLLDGGGIAKALMVLGLILLVQQIEGNLLQPVIMSRAVQIHPLAVIIAVTAGALLAGIIGALVAVPIVAVLNSVIRRLNRYHQLPPPTYETGTGPAPPGDSGGGAGQPAERPGDDLGVGGVPERRERPA